MKCEKGTLKTDDRLDSECLFALTNPLLKILWDNINIEGTNTFICSVLSAEESYILTAIP